jgi:hypothetical protein
LWTLLITAPDIKIQPSPIQPIQKRRPSSEGYVFPGVAFCPTGGIDGGGAADYLALPNVPMVGGSWMAPKDAIASGDWPRIRRLAERAAAIGRAPSWLTGAA